MKNLKFLLFFSFLLLSFQINYTTTYADTILFEDDFNNSLDKWNILKGDWELIQDPTSNEENDKLLKSVLIEKNREGLITPDFSFDQDNYTASVKMQSKNGVDQNLFLRFSRTASGFNYYWINLRAKGWVDSNNIVVAKVEVVDGNENILWRKKLFPGDIGCDIENDFWYHVKVNVNENNLIFYLKCPQEDKFRKIYTYRDDNAPFLTGGVALRTWTGSWGYGLEKWFDDFKVYIEEEEDYPLVLIPGLSASWNTRAMIYGEDVSASEWDLIPFAKPVYQRLIDSIEANGYVQGDNFFVWPYDWRQNLVDIESDLDNFILSESKLSSASKIDFIGHSLGGLASRNWAQNNQDQAGEVITVGSPHQGAVQAYQALAGGRIGEQRDWEWIGMQLLVHLNRDKLKSNAQVIQNIAPVLNDLLPTFDYLQKDDLVLGWDNVSFSNYYLSDLNNLALSSGFDQEMDYVIGYGKQVPRWLILESRSLMDQLLNKWPDGRMGQVIFDSGDGTVLVDSAYLGDNFSSFEYYHKELVEKEDSIKEILTLLGKDNPDIVPMSESLPEEMLVFYLASPANLRVIDNQTGEVYLPDNPNLQMLILPYPDTLDQYKAEIIGTGEGVYHLHIGEILLDKTNWQTYEHSITSGEVQDVDLVPETADSYFEQAIRIIKSIENYETEPWLIQAVDKLENKNPEQASYSLARYSFQLIDGQLGQWEKIKSTVELINAGWKLMLDNESFDLASAENKQSLAYRLIRRNYQNPQSRMKTMIWEQAVDWMEISKTDEPLISIADNFLQASYLNW